MRLDERLQRHRFASDALSALTDSELLELLSSGQHLGVGIGGQTLSVEVDDITVFVKRIPVTAIEYDSLNSGSTRNIFGLPAFCHYGIGSPGFGVWRELAALDITSGWVSDGRTSAFPLTYHVRVLPGEPAEPSAEMADPLSAITFWNNSPAVGARLSALRTAPAAAWVFMELLPLTLAELLAQASAGPTDGFEAICSMVETELHAAIDLMNGSGFQHMDAHFDNILTDSENLYFADLGLALSTDFELADDERIFFSQHGDHDRSYVFTYYVRHLLNLAAGVHPEQHGNAVAEVLAGKRIDGLSGQPRRIVEKYAPIAAVMMSFYHDLRKVSRTIPYPLEAERQAWATTKYSSP